MEVAVSERTTWRNDSGWMSNGMEVGRSRHTHRVPGNNADSDEELEKWLDMLRERRTTSTGLNTLGGDVSPATGTSLFFEAVWARHLAQTCASRYGGVVKTGEGDG